MAEEVKVKLKKNAIDRLFEDNSKYCSGYKKIAKYYKGEIILLKED